MDPDGDESTFDPSLYGMTTEYDADGNYKYPEGFDPDSGEWLEGYEVQRETWEAEYASAHTRWEAHKKQVTEANRAEAEAADVPVEPNCSSAPSGGEAASGTLASDEALAALRDKLTGA